MISNIIMNIETNTIGIPVIVRANAEGWIRDFRYWVTKIDSATSYIDCTQTFGVETGNYIKGEINPLIGYYDKELFIKWKALIDSEDIPIVHSAYNGKLRACTYQKGYCVYYGTGTAFPWMHSIIMNQVSPDVVVHHIDGISSDNRKSNLHILSKREHDSINHPKTNERKIIFADPKLYHQKKKEEKMDRVIKELVLIVSQNAKEQLIGSFAEGNLDLAKEILEIAKLSINLSSIKAGVSENRKNNTHLDTNYLDAYALDLLLKQLGIKPNTPQKEIEQVRMF